MSLILRRPGCHGDGKGYKKADGSVILNFRKASTDVLETEGFYDVVKPSFDPQTQTKGGLYFDEDNEIVTYDVTNIDFSQDFNYSLDFFITKIAIFFIK